MSYYLKFGEHNRSQKGRSALGSHDHPINTMQYNIQCEFSPLIIINLNIPSLRNSRFYPSTDSTGNSFLFYIKPPAYVLIRPFLLILAIISSYATIDNLPTSNFICSNDIIGLVEILQEILFSQYIASV